MANISLAWTGDLESLKLFVKKILNLDGVWSQPGSDRKVFTYADSSVMWRKNKGLLSFAGEKSDKVKQEVCKHLCMDNSTKPTQSVLDQSDEPSNDCAEAIESLKSDQKLSNETIQSSAESVSRISTVVSQLQTRLESSEFNTPYLYSQTKESGNVNQLKNDDSCIVMTELSKSPEHTNIDLRAMGIKENEQSTPSEIYLNRQSMEINDITNLSLVFTRCQHKRKDRDKKPNKKMQRSVQRKHQHEHKHISTSISVRLSLNKRHFKRKPFRFVFKSHPTVMYNSLD